MDIHLLVKKKKLSHFMLQFSDYCSKLKFNYIQNNVKQSRFVKRGIIKKYPLDREGNGLHNIYNLTLKVRPSLSTRQQEFV